MFGLIGWSVAIPTLLGAALGMWIDSKVDGRQSWTLMLLIGGLVLGCLNAWRWVREESEIR
jgi:ATP synthase protein I